MRLKCSVAFTKSSQFSKGDVNEVDDDDADDGGVGSVVSVSPSVAEKVEGIEADTEPEANGTGSS